MPLPTKKENETKPEFISRCMADAKTLEEYPNAPQRFAICQAQWTK
jgi:hypothetical protein